MSTVIKAIIEKILVGLLVLTMLLGAGSTLYAVVEHGKVTAATALVEAARLDAAQANAEAKLSASEAAATRAAYDVQSKQINAAKNNHAVSTANLASAVAANPGSAQAEVSADIWDAIYGKDNATQ